MILRKNPFENIVGKGEPTFSAFPTIFSTRSTTEIIILVTFYLPSANAFNLVQSEKLSIGHELILFQTTNLRLFQKA